VYNGGISPSWKWWQTILQIEISCNQWEHFGGFFSLVWGRMGLLNFCFSQCVPMTFPWCCQHVPQIPNVFPQCIPNSSSFDPISFALSSNVVTYITNPKEEITTYIFWDFSMLDLFFWWWANQKCPSQKKINWTLGSP